MINKENFNNGGFPNNKNDKVEFEKFEGEPCCHEEKKHIETKCCEHFHEPRHHNCCFRPFACFRPFWCCNRRNHCDFF